ncbi:hypothetical protein [Pedobacter sp. AJM]|uniref:hypothetical protein n=1 Tax=Pedobacter sp. AJM TaxID=2003629 RepID=UPI001124FA43|nr:hypothetical protein [Pedobacter sp. AJM]
MEENKGELAEQYVAELIYASYLKYWCYPNPMDIEGDYKEICDLLICFREVAIIISVKNYSFNGNYERYKKKVVSKSTDQLNGAERKLFFSDREIVIQHPERAPEVFDRRRYSKAFKITVNAGEQFENYALSDEKSGKGIVSIVNKETFEVMVAELDTMPDLIEYLLAREEFLLAHPKAIFNFTEKDLIAIFLMHARIFPDKLITSINDTDESAIKGLWERYHHGRQAQSKRAANQISYLIDGLVEHEVLRVRNGESIARELMQLSRTERRMFSETLVGLVHRYQYIPDAVARSYSEFNGIGYLMMYYPLGQRSESVDFILQKAMEIYVHKYAPASGKVLLLAVSAGLTGWKFGLFEAAIGVDPIALAQLETLARAYGWFTDMTRTEYTEKEYPLEE